MHGFAKDVFFHLEMHYLGKGNMAYVWVFKHIQVFKDR
jgi:hypothetical protein